MSFFLSSPNSILLALYPDKCLVLPYDLVGEVPYVQTCIYTYIHIYIYIYIYVHIFSNQIPVKLNKAHYMITQWDVYVYVAGTFGVYFVPFSDTGQYT